ncbi:MAG: TlyA family RNA methyltransferase, partial [Chloroflexales bacterium]|nr:TlyA family RNA methyltransferase [Chloroflexales bacterium]
MAKTRLDQLLVNRNLAESRSKAQALIMAGDVRVAGQVQTRPALPVNDDADVEVVAALPYVSRGGYKLAHALDSFGLDPTGLVALDAGASTGGFTDVLLQRGARLVYAVDVGYGILHWKLRQDPRVVVLERTNIRYLDALPPESAEPRAQREEQSDSPSALIVHRPALADCGVVDVAFISLSLVLPAIQRLIAPGAWVVALVKPQFEAGAAQVGKGGVVRDPAVHRAVLRRTLAGAASMGLATHGLVRSPLTGPAGNIEFLAWLQPGKSIDIEQAINGA